MLAEERLVPANGVGPFLSGVKHGMEPNINRPGRDIKAVQLGSPYPQFCQSECARTPGCRSWTYAPPRPHPTDPNLPAITLAVCHVKSSLTPGIPAPGMVSGINFAEHF
jgi:hypothetical protein